jgi:hypothetical protein
VGNKWTNLPRAHLALRPSWASQKRRPNTKELGQPHWAYPDKGALRPLTHLESTQSTMNPCTVHRKCVVRNPCRCHSLHPYLKKNSYQSIHIERFRRSSVLVNLPKTEKDRIFIANKLMRVTRERKDKFYI